MTKHHPAAFINTIHESGTKAEAVKYLQETWNDLCQAKEEIARLRQALSFYADGRRYQGPNQKPIPDDPFAKPDAVYILDVSRDGGAIAASALSSQLLGTENG